MRLLGEDSHRCLNTHESAARLACEHTRLLVHINVRSLLG
jgi:hypothetical protein